MKPNIWSSVLWQGKKTCPAHIKKALNKHTNITNAWTSNFLKNKTSHSRSNLQQCVSVNIDVAKLKKSPKPQIKYAEIEIEIKVLEMPVRN